MVSDVDVMKLENKELSDKVSLVPLGYTLKQAKISKMWFLIFLSCVRLMR